MVLIFCLDVYQEICIDWTKAYFDGSCCLSNANEKSKSFKVIIQEIDVDGTGSADKDEFAVAMNRVDPTLEESDLKVLLGPWI